LALWSFLRWSPCTLHAALGSLPSSATSCVADLADDPDWAYDVAEEVYPVWVNCDPEDAARSAFGVYDEPADSGAMRRTLH
jgi:hypothetical protein